MSRASLAFDRHAVAPNASIWRDSPAVGRLASTISRVAGKRRCSSRSSAALASEPKLTIATSGFCSAEHLGQPLVLDAVGDELEALVLLDQRPQAPSDDVLELGECNADRGAGHDHRAGTPPHTRRDIGMCRGKGEAGITRSRDLTSPRFHPSGGDDSRATIQPEFWCCNEGCGSLGRDFPNGTFHRGTDESETAVSLLVVKGSVATAGARRRRPRAAGSPA